MLSITTRSRRYPLRGALLERCIPPRSSPLMLNDHWASLCRNRSGLLLRAIDRTRGCVVTFQRDEARETEKEVANDVPLTCTRRGRQRGPRAVAKTGHHIAM